MKIKKEKKVAGKKKWKSQRRNALESNFFISSSFSPF